MVRIELTPTIICNTELNAAPLLPGQAWAQQYGARIVSEIVKESGTVTLTYYLEFQDSKKATEFVLTYA